MESRTFRLRVTYRKTGRVAMLSHLEITHALERIVRRAHLPFALSQGFSPHMKIAFGSALPVGIGGKQEIFDLQLTDYIAPAKVLASLQDAAPVDLMPIECRYIESKEKAASVAYPFSLYEAVLENPIDDLDWPCEIEVVRKGKTKTLVVSNYLVGKPTLDGNRIIFQLESKDTGNLRPDVLLAKMVNPDEVVSVTRIAQSSNPI